MDRWVDGWVDDGGWKSGREGEEIEGERGMDGWASTIDSLHARHKGNNDV